MKADERPTGAGRRLLRRLRRTVASRAGIDVARWRLATRRVAALEGWTGPATVRHPLFVGGTGRSGTTITARILGAHPAYKVIPYEVHFITDAGGLCDAVAGRTSIAQFERRFIRRWWTRPNGRGVHLIAAQDLVAASLRELRSTFEREPAAAARRFTHRLLDPIAYRAGAEGWIEMTPGNVLMAPGLLRIFPKTQVIHSVRDGRDVACSVARLRWGPSEPEEALRWWGQRIERSFSACDGLPPERVLVVQQEALTTHAREPELRRLLRWVGLDEHPDIRSFFDENVTSQRAHRKRWQQDVRPERRDAFAAAHAVIASRLRERGWPYVADDAAAEGAGPATAAPASDARPISAPEDAPRSPVATGAAGPDVG